MVRLMIILLSFGFTACVDPLPEVDSDQGLAKQCELDRQCPASAPYCRANFCIECENDNDCTGIRPACSEQRCVECVTNEHCPSAVPACSNERCVECVVDSDCPTARAACSNERCIECLEDSHCPSDRPLCDNRSCIACRNHSDCPLDRGLCLANQCNVDPAGLATWDHRNTVLVGEGSYHGAALGSSINMERVPQLVRGGWSIEILGNSGWARLSGEDLGVAAIHRSGLLLTRVVDEQYTMWSPRWEQLRAYGPGIRLDTRGLVGYGTLRQLVLDLEEIQALSVSGALDLLEGATHRFEMAQRQSVMISDTVLGSMSYLDGVGSESLSRLERSAWPGRDESLVGEIDDFVLEKRINFSLDEPGQLELFFVDREAELCTRFISLTASVWVDECRDCSARLFITINGDRLERGTNERWSRALDRGSHELTLRAVSNETDEGSERCAVGTTEGLRLRGVLESQPEWLRAVVRTTGDITLNGWDQGSRSSFSYNHNRRPTILKLPQGEVSDADFDGWPDDSDLCLGIADNMADKDQDGVGDACDGVFNTIWQNESTLQALDHNGQVLFEYEDLDATTVAQIVPVARTSAFPHQSDFVNKSAIEQMLIIKSGLNSPARLVNGLGQTVFTVFDTEPTQLGRVSSDGQFTLFNGIQEDRRVLLIKGINAFGTQSNVMYTSSNPKGVARLTPSSSTLASFLGASSARMLMLGQTNKPIHTDKLSGSLVAGYIGDCSEAGYCDENSTCHENIRCTIQPETPDRCLDGNQARAMRTCVPDHEIGYCVKSRVDASGETLWAGSSFAACEPNEQTCLDDFDCPGDLACLLGRCRRDTCWGDPCPEGQICLGGYGSDSGVCVPAVSDERCGDEEHCVSGNGVFLEIKGALARHGGSRGIDRFGTANIITIPPETLHSRALQDMGEITWCHPSLEMDGPFALGENESRDTLKKLFDGSTPWRDLFRLGLTQADVIEGDNFLGLTHAEETRCNFIEPQWSVDYDRRLNALEMEVVDIDHNGMEEIRIGYGIEGSQRPTIWRCYDIFGSLIPGDCAP